MKSFREVCAELPESSNYGGLGMSAVPPLMPEHLKLYFRIGRNYQMWGRVFSHEFFCLVYMVSGKRTVTINDCSHVLNAGEFIFIPPYAKHSFGDEYRDFEALQAVFTISGDSRRLIDISAQCWRLTRKEEKTLRQTIACLRRWQNEDVAAAEEAVCYFAVFLRQIQSIAVPELKERKLKDSELPLLNKIIAYLAANRHRHVSVAELSKKFHISGSTLRQHFRKKMNVSIGHYQLVRRLNRGMELLRSTDLSVAEIAEKVGFASANGFMLALKRETGETPKYFRRRWQY